jgi:RimJ/RimL family protein N-acetyltransferase
MRVIFPRLPDHQRAYSLVERDDGVVYQLHGGVAGRRLPHDIVHLVVERELRIGDGIWGAIAAGVVFSSMTHVSGRRRPHAEERSRRLLREFQQHGLRAELLADLVAATAALAAPTPQRIRALAATNLAVLPDAEVDPDAIAAAARALQVEAARWARLRIGEHLDYEWPVRGRKVSGPMRPPELIDCGSITLRRWRQVDAESMLRAVTESKDHLSPWMPWAEGYSHASATEFLAATEREWLAGTAYNYAIIVDGVVAGGCGLHSRIGPGGLEIGYWVHHAYLRRGVATAAAGALTEQALLLPGIDRVEIHHNPRNVASGGVPRRLGFALVVCAGEDGTVWRRVADSTEAELTAFMRAYERATNSHDVARVVPLIAEDATYWFTDGSYHGREAVARAIGTTFASIRDEVYQISELEWIACTHEQAVCRYRFAWTGMVTGQSRTGEGRGTNVLVRRDGGWQMLHEHLSALARTAL